MKELNRKSLIGILRTFAMLVVVFFVPACIISVWVAKNDPALLERRLKAGPTAEKEWGQKVVQVITSIVFLADFLVPAIDHRLGWSSVPAYACVIGDQMMLAGFVIVFEVFKANSFTSGIIEVAEDQKVISSGPYAIVRHPMYTGGLIMLFGIPLALGSWWGMLVNLPMTAAVIWRLL